MSDVNAGELRHIIDIQKNAAASNEMGQKAPASLQGVPGLVGLHASINTTGGGELYAAQKVHPETTALIKLRYKTGIKAGMFVKYGNRTFYILFPNDLKERHQWLYLSCKEVL